MIRASNFCRSSEEFNVQLVLHEGNCEPQSSLVSWRVLRRLSRLTGTRVTLSCPATKKCIHTRLVLAEDDTDDTSVDEENLVVRANVLTASNLLSGTPISQIHNVRCILNTLSNDEDLPTAKCITLRIWGIPLPPPRLTYSPPKENFPLPARKTLLQKDILIAARQGDNICIYEVIDIDCNENGSIMAYETSSDTSFRIEMAEHKLACPHLPPLKATCHLFTATTSSLPPHPDTSVLIEALSLPIHSSPQERVLHVRGELQNVTEAVHVAADRLGRRLVPVRGLAFYAHFHGRVKNPTGSLVDKLIGLEVALEQALYHAPAVLLLQDLDKELSIQDRELQEDEESRILSILMDYLKPSSNSNFRNGKGSNTPPILVVLSSEKKLKSGPLTRNIVHPSVVCSIPDANYIKYLWKQHIKDIPVTELLCEILSGRTREQVCRILQNVQRQLSPDVADLIALLREICEEHDNKTKLSSMAKIPKVHWEDVGGLSHVRSEIMEAIELPLQHPNLFPPSTRSGILLYGPPGTGKTLVAKAVATECKLPFLSVKGPELLGSYIGESEGNVREVFAQARTCARQNKPPACILFFDELDSLAPRRGEQASGGNVMDRVVATFFGELDKDAKDCSIFVMGATNRPDLLDPSLLRPGRFDRLVYLGIFPEDRAQILAAQIRKLNLKDEPHVLAKFVVDKLPNNLTGADLSTIATGAQLLATERLCAEAENEFQMQQANGNSELTMDQLLESWNEERLVPTVTLDDLIQASEKVVPSVSEADLKRYELLRDQFRR
ncbi:peroxin-6 [Fistulifera solaris]|uniref:Peroxisomal ATPase PEX6 n=1 Tax=Fistulifera solaris TaxID=1519565 RepID=A0A1Z5KG20_FISSO|nr:peroxin-6 [Fistulifera solaris]|eukprot:GAX25199.1 peroxin-6 [Fistulifera solaris]